MALFDRPTYNTNNVQSLADKPNESATILKQTFDKTGDDTKTFLEDHIDELEAVTPGSAGGDKIGGYDVPGASGSTVMALITSLGAAISGAILGQIPDGSLPNVKLATDIKIGSLAALTTTIKDSVVNAINELKSAVDLKALLSSNVKSITFTEQIVTSSGGAATINWDNGNKAVITLTENTTLTFSAPSNTCDLRLRVIQDGTGGWELTYPPSVIWADGDVRQPSVSPGAKNIISMAYDGTEYWSAMSINFS